MNANEIFQATQEEKLVRKREAKFGPDIGLCYSADLLHEQGDI